MTKPNLSVFPTKLTSFLGPRYHHPAGFRLCYVLNEVRLRLREQCSAKDLNRQYHLFFHIQNSFKTKVGLQLLSSWPTLSLPSILPGHSPLRLCLGPRLLLSTSLVGVCKATGARGAAASPEQRLLWRVTAIPQPVSLLTLWALSHHRVHDLNPYGQRWGRGRWRERRSR